MTARSFTVETRAQAALILGGPESLASRVVKECQNLGLHAISLKTIAQLEQLAETYDPDYLLVLLDEKTTAWLVEEGRAITTRLESLIQSGQTRFFVALHQDRENTSIPFTNITHKLVYTDFVGEDTLVSPLLTSWLTTVNATHQLVIPGDGLQEISLLGESDLARGLVLALVHPSGVGGEKIFLGNPEMISVSSLAYNIQADLPFKVAVSYTEEEVVGSSLNQAFTETLTHLNWELANNVQTILKSYLSQYFGNLTSKVQELSIPPAIEVPVELKITEAEQEIIPETRVVPSPRQEPHISIGDPVPKKLTPLRSAAPVFVPLTSRRKRWKLPTVKLSLPKLDFSRRNKSAPPSIKGIIGKGIVIALALYLGSLAFALTISLLSLRDIAASLKNGSIPVTNKFTDFAGTYLEANWVAVTSLPGLSQNTYLQSGSSLLDSYNQALHMFATARSLSATTADLTKYILGSGNSDITNSISESRLQVEELYQELSLLSGSLPEEKPAIIPTRYSAYYQAGRARLTKLEQSVITTKAMLAALPNLIGLGGHKKYGVLFQNNMELRATGGFIGSFAILSFENGKLYDMPVYDVYAADGQLKGHVEPPKPIKDILGEANWYLRDSNFDPDFPTSARRAEWFIKKTLNQDLDGTIAVDVDSLKDLLSAVGPLTIPDYNETITADNLYERTQFHAEVNFFPGSTQKKEFLSTVGNALFAKLPTLGAGDGLKLISALTSSIEEKNTLISLVNSTDDRVFSTLNWNGQIDDLPCPMAPTCQKDYTMVVDSNFGVNKANYFLKRTVQQTLTLNKDLSVEHVLALKYTNTSTSDSWPAGEYKNYQRVYLPSNVIVESIQVGDTVLSTKDYTATIEHNKLDVAYLVTVPINTTMNVKITYQLPAVALGNSPVYTWYWQKQPGTGAADPVLVTLNYPMFLKPEIISPQGALGSQQLKFNLANDTDHRITVQFSQ